MAKPKVDEFSSVLMQTNTLNLSGQSNQRVIKKSQSKNELRPPGKIILK